MITLVIKIIIIIIKYPFEFIVMINLILSSLFCFNGVNFHSIFRYSKLEIFCGAFANSI